MSSFRRIEAKHETALSDKIWELKENEKTFDIKWEIVTKAPSYSNISKICHLCLTEKTLILYADSQFSINKKSEIMQKCRHKNKWFLKVI